MQIDKFWITILDSDKDIRYYSRKEAEDVLTAHGGEGYILKAVAYVDKPQIIDIR
jgi:hypothetical protein